MTVTTCVRAHALLVRDQKHTICRRLDAVMFPRSRCLQPHAQGDSAERTPPPPPPKTPSKGTAEGDQPDDRPGGPSRGFFIIVLCVYVALFPMERAMAVESLPIDNSDPNTGPLQMGGPSEGPKDCLLYTSPSPRD